MIKKTNRVDCTYSQTGIMKDQQGYTLIELLTALTLGLLLVAAATQLLFTGQVAYRVQKSQGSLQDNGVFGIEYLSRFVRIANYGNIGAIHDRTLRSGILISGESAASSTATAIDGNLHGIKLNGATVSTTELLTRNAIGDSIDASKKSDQLTILYRAPRAMNNCASIGMTGPDLTNAAVIPSQSFERYHIEKVNNEYNLYCDSSVTPANTTDISGVGNQGVLIGRNIEYMRILLNVQLNVAGPPTFRTMSVSEYLALPMATVNTVRPAISAVQIAILTRASEKITAQSRLPTSYQVLDQSITVPTDGYMRTVYSTTIAMRNGMGAE